MASWSARVLIVGLIFGLATSSTDSATDGNPNETTSQPALAVRLTPRIAFGPSNVRALIQVEPHPDNRLLRVTIDSGGYYRSTDIQLEGAETPKSHFVVWKSVPPGQYIFAATVFGPGVIRHRAVQHEFQLLSRVPES